jgi:hypothetical protein
MWTIRRITWLAVAVLMLPLSMYLTFSLVENLGASQIMVVQSPTGNLSVYTDPGPQFQGFGTVTKYPRRDTYEFNTDGKVDNCKQIRFNDGGHAKLCGSVSWEMPLEPESILKIHKAFGSTAGIETAAVSKMIDSAVYLAGPLMSSTESSGERRADLVQYINDQAEKGVYVTHVITKDVVDPLSGQKRETLSTEIMRDAAGLPKRQQSSLLADFNINLLPISISELKYDKIVEDQIAQRQKATTEVQIAQANARKAEQDAITTEAKGRATAAEARWKQETIKAQAVTEGQQKLEVATLGAKEAEQYKREQILRGEGDSQRKQLVMNADGALDQKLEAYKEVNAKYAAAIATAQPGAWTPVTQMGGSGGTGATNASTLIDLFTAKAARDLGIDMAITGKAATAAKAK